MTEPTKLNRRDWFRLRIPRPNQTLGETVATDRGPGLKKIDHPPNHDGMDFSELPPMREAFLSTEQVHSLFSDINQLASNVLLMQRAPGASNYANVAKGDSTEKLDSAKRALLDGTRSRLQIRYQWQSAMWIDTLEIHSLGYRLVRITHKS